MIQLAVEEVLLDFIFFLLFPPFSHLSYLPLKPLSIQIPKCLLEPCHHSRSSSAFEPCHQAAASTLQHWLFGAGCLSACLFCVWGVRWRGGQREPKPKALCSISLQVCFRYSCHGMLQLSKISSIKHKILERYSCKYLLTPYKIEIWDA